MYLFFECTNVKYYFSFFCLFENAIIYFAVYCPSVCFGFTEPHFLSILELWSPDADGKLQLIHSQNLFCIIRCIMPFRLASIFSFLFFLLFFSFICLPCPGSTRDHLVLTSDSGSITVAEWRSHHWETVHNETFGRSECRRVVAGEYLAADPKGRAVLVGRSRHRTLLLLLLVMMMMMMMIMNNL